MEPGQIPNHADEAEYIRHPVDGGRGRAEATMPGWYQAENPVQRGLRVAEGLGLVSDDAVETDLVVGEVEFDPADRLVDPFVMVPLFTIDVKSVHAAAKDS